MVFGMGMAEQANQLSTPTIEQAPATPVWTAEALRWGANALSSLRAVGGVALGLHIANHEFPAANMAPVAVAGGLMATDYLDGKVARAATAIDGQRSRLGAWMDQMTDKVFVTAMIGGTAAAQFANGHTAAGSVVAASGLVITARDAYVTRKRMQAEQGPAVVDTSAKWHGKVKTAVQFGALALFASPAMEYPPVEATAVGALGLSALLAVLSARKYRKAFTQS